MTVRSLGSLAFAALGACTPTLLDPTSKSTTDTDPGPTGGPTDTVVDTTPDPSTTGETGGPPTDTGVPWDTEVDCSALLPAPLSYTRYDWVPGSEDFTFSADGYLVQVTGGGLKRTPFGGPSELLVPFAGDVRGTRYLPDGRLALNAIESGSVVLLDPVTGVQEVIASGLQNPNGMAIDLEGRIYVATTGRILRIDPATGEQFVVADLPGNSFDGITFSPDYKTLYFDEEVGQIHYVEFDANGEPGEPKVGASIPTSLIIPFSILDGMSMDACGNLYVIEMNGKVWRVKTNGVVETVVDIGGAAIIPAMNFGYPPVGGWSPTALYVITFTGAVYEVEVGVPGKWEPHLPPE